MKGHTVKTCSLASAPCLPSPYGSKQVIAVVDFLCICFQYF